MESYYYKFSTKANRYVNNLWSTTTNTSRAISGLGKVDITNDLDTAKVSGGGVKATTTAGQVEWAIINPYDANLGGHQLLIDEREFDGTGVDVIQESIDYFVHGKKEIQ